MDRAALDVIVSNEAGQPTLRSQNEVQKNQRERAAEADPRVKEVLARSSGARSRGAQACPRAAGYSDASGDDPSEISDATINSDHKEYVDG